MKAQIWYSQMGQASTTPAAAPTLRRSANWSNGPVPNSTHVFGSAVNTAREEAVGRFEHLTERGQAEHRHAEPDVTEDRGDRDRDQRDGQPVAQLVEVFDERHRAVGVAHPPTAQAKRDPDHGSCVSYGAAGPGVSGRVAGRLSCGTSVRGACSLLPTIVASA